MGLFSRKKKQKNEDEDFDDEQDDEESGEQVLFQGAVNGNEANLQENGKLVQVALVPLKETISDALSRRSEGLRIEPKGKAGLIFFVIDSVPYAGNKVPLQQANAMVQMAKLLAGLDIRERSRPQSGGIKAEYKGKKSILQIKTTPTESGVERLVLSVRDPKVELESPQNLGFSEEFKEKVREAAAIHDGFMLVCGPPGSGVTTVKHGVLRSVDSFTQSIYSLASDEGIPLINIAEFEPEPGDELDHTVTRIVRNEANILYVDPFRSAADVKLWLKHTEDLLIVSEFPARDCVSGLFQMAKWIGPKVAAEKVRVLYSGKRVRLLCDKCKQVFRPNPKFIQKVGLPPEVQTLSRAFQPPQPTEEEPEPEYTICRQCGGTGYYGTVPLIEMLLVDDTVKKILLSEPDPKKLKAYMQKSGMQTFQAEGLKLVAQNKTSLEELQRVFKAG